MTDKEEIWSDEAIADLEGNAYIEGDSGLEDPAVYKPAVESALFTLGRAMTPSELAKCAFCSTGIAKKAARMLMEEYDRRNGGIIIREMNGLFQMCTNPAYYDNLIRLVSAPRKPVLTDVVMETLAIIAYRSPVTKVEIEKIRGVSSDHAVNKLIEFGLVEETGRLDAPGRPALFSVTPEFYRRFGISGKSDMPVIGPEMESIIEEEVESAVRDAVKVEV